MEVFLNEMEDSRYFGDDDDAQVLGETSALGLNLSVRAVLNTTDFVEWTCRCLVLLVSMHAKYG